MSIRVRMMPCSHMVCLSCAQEAIEGFSCCVCSQSSTAFEYLHPLDKPEICTEPDCGQIFLNLRSLAYHREVAHGYSLTDASPSDTGAGEPNDTLDDASTGYAEARTESLSRSSVPWNKQGNNNMEMAFNNNTSQQQPQQKISLYAGSNYGNQSLSNTATGVLGSHPQSRMVQLPAVSSTYPVVSNQPMISASRPLEPSNVATSGLGAVFAAEDDDDLDDLS